MKLFSEILSKLRNKRNKLVELSEKKEVEKKKPYNVTLTKVGNFYKLDVGEDVSLSEYCEIINEIDVYNFDKMFNVFVVYDGVNDLVRKGTYYAFKHNEKTFNIGLRDLKTIIYQREELEEYSETIDIVHNIESNVSNLSVLRHDKNGSTYYTKYYCTKDSSYLPDNWVITYDDAKNTINTVLDELSSMDDINQIFDVESFRKIVLGMMEEFNKNSLKRERINQ